MTIFVTQFFAFYNNQITQVLGLAVALLTYAAIRSMQSWEQSRAQSAEPPERERGAVASV